MQMAVRTIFTVKRNKRMPDGQSPRGWMVPKYPSDCRVLCNTGLEVECRGRKQHANDSLVLLSRPSKQHTLQLLAIMTCSWMQISHRLRLSVLSKAVLVDAPAAYDSRDCRSRTHRRPVDGIRRFHMRGGPDRDDAQNRLEATVGRCQRVHRHCSTSEGNFIEISFLDSFKRNEAGDDCRTITIACMSLPQIATTGYVASIGLFTRLE